MSDILYKEECYAIQGAIFEVYREKGCGFVEAVYQECLEIEFRLRQLPVEAHPVLPLRYKGQDLRQTFIPDFVYDEKIVIELKATKSIVDEYRAQVMNYLKASGLRLGLLVNFGHYPKVEIERIVH